MNAQRAARAWVVLHLEALKRIALHGSNGSPEDDELIRMALAALIGDVLSYGLDELYINAGN